MATADSEHKRSTVLDSWNSLGEKTVFILDRSRYFTHVSSGHSIEGDSTKKPNGDVADENYIPPFDRSLWTCTVEAVVGYSRLVWDLFTPEQRCISIVSFGPNTSPSPMEVSAEPYIVEKICSWRDEDQNLEHLLRSLARRSYSHQVNLPEKLTKTTDITSYPNCDLNSIGITKALDQALSDLGHMTKAQVERRAAKRFNPSSITSTAPKHTGNHGRVILISSFKNEAVIHKIVADFEQEMLRKNSLLMQAIDLEGVPGIQLSPVEYCDLVIVNTFPICDEGVCSKIGNISAFKPQLHVKTFSVRSGKMIAGLLDNLCLQHNNLRSTTITGIPMKEEQSASSSSQYDVEIAHCSSIHDEVLGLGSNYLNGIVADIDRNGFPCRTFKLNWCTPKPGNTAEFQQCAATSRITSVDVNSRPSACLTNFLLNGKQVMLELFKSKNNRMITHVLASHGGELYIHSLITSRYKQAIAEAPPISDGLGGKVGDYRINDFVALMKQHTLVKSTLWLPQDDPLNRTCRIIKRQTLYWPLTLGHTILWNVGNLLGDLITKVPREVLTQAEVDECKAAIDSLMKFEKNGQGLPSTTIVELIRPSATSTRASKLDQLYKLLWNELEYFLRVHNTTPEHESVLDHLLERHVDRNQPSRGTRRAASKQIATTVAQAPMKKRRVMSKLIPEISDEVSIEQIQQTSMFYKSGMSILKTYASLYHHYHRMRNKLPFVGRNKPEHDCP